MKKLTEDVGFIQSKVDECILYKGNVIYLLYTDNMILAGPDKSEIDEVIEQIQGAKLDITVEGDLQDFLGVRITCEADGLVHFTQPHLIDKILKNLQLDNDEVTTRDVTARSSVLLLRHSNSKDFDGVFNYRLIIGMLGYLEMTRSDIMYTSCPFIWKSQLQTEIVLSTTESEYTRLWYALRETILIMDLLDQMSERGFKVSRTKAKMHCKVFEDTSGALEIAKNPQYRPQIKHLNVKLHHFRSYVANKRISIHKIDTKEQLADYLTKPVPVLILTYLRKL